MPILGGLCIGLRRSFGYRALLLVLLSMLILSCERPLENPELSDQIYNDLLKEAKAASAAAETEKKNLESTIKDIADLRPGDNNGKIKIRKKYELEHKVEMLTQKANFYRLRAFKRKEYVLDTYPKYFAKKLHWPDKEEWTEYQASKRLQLASRDWGQRVPKLGKRIKEYNTSAAAAYSSAPKGEGGAKPEEKKKSEAPSEEKEKEE